MLHSFQTVKRRIGLHRNRVYFRVIFLQSSRRADESSRCSETGEKGAILRREGLYSSIITDWRRQHRQGLLKAAVGRSDLSRGGPSISELNKLKTENERLRRKLAQAEVVIEVQGKVHALLEEISKSAATDE